jgi:hypothetical protein
MTRETREAQGRPARVSVSQQRDKLNVIGLDKKNFHYRWVNDEGDRLMIFKNALYEFVDKSEIKSSGDPTIDTSKGTDSRVRKGVGGGKVAYLMKLPMELRKIDEANKEAEILETERAMTRVKSETNQHSAAQDADYGSLTLTRK